MSTRSTIGGAAALLAGVAFVGAEAVAASAWSRPTYDYATNYISDLGVAGCPTTYAGRAICSPLSAVMNAGFALNGLLLVLAAVVLVGLGRGLARWIALVLAVGYGGGMVAVALVAENVGSPLHVIGATLAIVAGNLASIAVGFVRDAPLGLRIPSLALGALGLVSAVLLETTDAAPDGVLERGAVYAITAVQLLLGAVAVSPRRRDAAMKVSSV